MAERYGLKEIGTRPPFGEYLRDFWSRKAFIGILATSKAYAKNQASYLGQFWTILNPTLNAAVYVLIFGFVLKANRGLDNATAYIIVGVFTFRFIDQAILAGASAIDSNLGLVRSHRFPRAVLPASIVITGVTLFVPTVLVMMAMSYGAGYLPGDGPVPVRWTWLLVPLAIALMTAFDIGLALFMARIGTGSPDLLNILPFLNRFLMYGSGVLFAIEHYVKNPTLAKILEHQPIAEYLRLMRGLVLSEPSIPARWETWGWCGAWAVFMLIVGFAFFWAKEETYGRD